MQMFPPLLCLLLLLGLLLCFPLGVFPLPVVKRCRQDLWIPSTLQGAVAKDTPLSRGIWSVTSPEVVVRLRS